jgi:ribonucleoside-diphosphate reductase alpha chain
VTADTGDPGAKKVNDRRFQDGQRPPIVTDAARDARLTDFGKDTLTDRYLLPGESYQDLFARVADAYADDQDHAQRLYDYISPVVHAGNARAVERRHQPRPADLVLPQLGRGQPRRHRRHLERERVAGVRGGGIGTYWGNVRGIGEPVGLNGKTSGIIPFVRVMDSLTLAISQGSLRRGSAACYLDISTRRSRSSSKSASLRAISTARR